ncbi:MAG: penicillin acylase family protein [Bacteroidia bacterium]|nr:penicillin acylase family protein [Bacteroidia bacterium]
MWKVTCLLAYTLAQAWDPTRIEIFRDSLGVAHIWAPTDAEAAFGAGWAQSEDVPIPLQHNLLAARGQLGRILGKEGAIWDFLLYFTGLDTIDYQKHIRAETWAVLEGFAAGVNAYFLSHPEKRLLPDVFPVTAHDIARGSHLILNLMTGLGRALQWIQTGYLSDIAALVDGYGSNAWAISPHRSADGGTWLLINSHQPLEGRFAWYEIHISSGEGWNFTGGTFPGSPIPFVGCNTALGWAHTFAYHHLTDVFALEVKKRRYRFGEKWLPFRERKIKLRLKGLPFPLPRKIYSSEYGPVMKIHHKWYAFSQLTYQETRALEQWYLMNKAHNLQAFLDAMYLQAVPTFNTIYADGEGHIAFLSWVQLPERDTALEWSIPVKYPTPAYQNDRRKIPPTELPTLIDPSCGYVYNANQTPLEATCPGENWKPSRKIVGLQRFTYNRGERLAELWPRFDGQRFTFEALRNLKHDRCIAREGSYRKVFSPLFTLSPEAHPALSEAILALKRWKGCAEPEDTLTALVMLTHVFLEKSMKMRLVEALILGYQPTEREVVRALHRATRILKKYYGTLYPQWQRVLQHGRGKVRVGVGGFPESLESRHWKWNPRTGKLEVMGGDGLTYWVHWGPEGQTVWGIQPYGASHVPDSPHYCDQVKPFAEGKLFKRPLDWGYIRSHSMQKYHPLPQGK